MFNLFDFNSSGDFEYLLSCMGQDILINNTEPRRVLITNRTLSEKYNDKNITSLSPLKRGDVFDFEGKKWMVISEESKRNNRWKGIARQLPFTLVVNNNCSFISVPCYIESSSFGFVDGKILSMATGELFVYTPDNEQTRQIRIGNRWMKFGQVFKIVGIDHYSQPGMIVFTCEKDEVDQATDDIENDIAGGLVCKIQITNSKPIEVSEGNTVQLSWEATGNTPVVFSSSDESVATVDQNGLVTGVSVGQAVITVANASRPLIKDDIKVKVVEAAEYSIVISGSNEIITELTETYTAQVFHGSTLVSEPVIWSLWDDSKTTTTTYATITSQDDVQCTVKAGTAINQYVQLKATLLSDSTVEAWFRIRIKPPF